jgi:hypothetical protein
VPGFVYDEVTYVSRFMKHERKVSRLYHKWGGSARQISDNVKRPRCSDRMYQGATLPFVSWPAEPQGGL